MTGGMCFVARRLRANTEILPSAVRACRVQGDVAYEFPTDCILLKIHRMWCDVGIFRPSIEEESTARS